MRKIIILIFFAGICSDLEAQIVGNKIDLCLGTTFSSFRGKEALKDDNFLYPSLFSGFRDQRGIFMKGMDQISPLLSIGLGAEFINLTDWESQNANEYTDSRITLVSVYPIIQFHTRFHETGLFNRIVFSIETYPVFGVSRLDLKHPVFDIRNSLGEVLGPMNSRDIFFGIGGSGGLIFALTNFIAFNLNYSIQYNRITSELFCDEHFTISKIGLGINFRFKKSKHYYY